MCHSVILTDMDMNLSSLIFSYGTQKNSQSKEKRGFQVKTVDSKPKIGIA